MIKEHVLALLTGQGVWLPLFVFVLLGIAIFMVATRLARYADAIADATGLGRLWIGTLLLAAATSLPELTTDVNAALLDVPDIAVGDLLGSTLANMLLLAVLDLVFARRRILQQVALDHVQVGAMAIVLTSLASVAMFSGGWGRIGWVGVDTVTILAVYLFGMHALLQSAHPSSVPAPPMAEQAAAPPLSGTLLRFTIAAVTLAMMAPLLVTAAEAIALESGASQTFVGTMLVGFTTSFPEIAASIAAIRMGALDLAVGNVFGSNAFNMCVLFAADLAYLKGPILAAVSPEHPLTGLVAVLCIALGIMGILARSRQHPTLLRVESLMIVVAYAGGMILLARGLAS